MWEKQGRERYCHEELGPGEERERKAGVVGDSSEGDGRGILFSDPIFVVVGYCGGSQQNSLFVYRCPQSDNSGQSVVCEDHRPEEKPAKATV